ncbi:PAS domain-containing sensor histidine kinase [Nocardioides sp. InS609-2]|uniref:sensor histidine kinase n=1 Tax=Nocardioides sp. InS609-2 TaxID=2760705 RepID=UPI0020BFFE7B|nr:PAS domain-containing sensor histidine kinase [Nocardioides sp. InS609-2]
MQGWTLFLVTVALYSALPLIFAMRRSSYQNLLMYAHIAGLTALGALLGAVYVFDFGDFRLSAGQVALGGFVFSTLVMVIVGRDLQVVRNIIALTISVNVLIYVTSQISGTALETEGVLNPSATSRGVFDVSLRVVVLGGLLIVLLLLVQLAILELAKRRLPSTAMPVVYVAAFVAILVMDGVLFPTLALTPTDDYLGLIRNGVLAKLVLAAAYSVPLLAFVIFFRPVIERFEGQPLNLRGLVTVSRDELEQRLERQQSELQTQRDQLHETTESAGRATATVDRILDSATNTILVALDPEFRVTQFNSGAQRLLGWESAEVTGRSPVMFHAADEVARQAEELGTDPDYAQVIIAQVGTGKRRDWEFLGRDGVVHMVSLSVTEIIVGGRGLGYLAAGEDVTSRLREENAVKSALRREHEAVVRLQEVNRVKQDLVSTVSHELRTPITSIHGYTELLSDGSFGQLTEEQAGALERVRHNAGRLEAMVNDLLVLERAETGDLELEFTPLDLRETVHDSSGILDEMLQGRALAVDMNLAASPVSVYGDRAAMERVLVNLLSNAVKFTPGEGRITVTVAADNGRAVLTVSDTGIGVGKDDQAQLFNRFFRAEEANERAIPGSGLGLSIVHAIVAGHGGVVGVESQPGGGTTISVSLPHTDVRPDYVVSETAVS